MAHVRPRRLLTLCGIQWLATPTAWVAVVWMAALGLVVGLRAAAGAAAGTRVLVGLADALLILASIVVHYLGGALAGRLVDAPMRRVVFTATLADNVYDEARA
jgi:hypothetical protein